MASYEYAWAPVRFETFALVHREYGLSPEWLATRTGSSKVEQRLENSVIARIPKRLLFSKAYDDYIAEDVKKQNFERLVTAARMAAAIDDLKELKKERQDEFISKALPVLDRMKREAAKSQEATDAANALFDHSNLQKRVEKVLDLITGQRNSPSVIPKVPTLDELLRDARRLASRPGKRTELARALGVPLPRVSEWLSERKGTPSPGGDYALRLLEWVQVEEAKQQQEGSSGASTPLEPGTRKQKGKHEPQKPSPRPKG